LVFSFYFIFTESILPENKVTVPKGSLTCVVKQKKLFSFSSLLLIESYTIGCPEVTKYKGIKYSKNIYKVVNPKSKF